MKTDEIYNPEFVRGLFDRMSNSYERMNYITSFGFSIRWRRQFLKHLKKTNGKVEIIDLLTGMGETWYATKKRFPQSSITVLDFSEGMLNYAKMKNNKEFEGEVIILKQDLLNNNLPSNYYDLVTCAFGLKTFNTEQLEILAQETKRILKTGGQFTFIEVSKPKNWLLKILYGFYLGNIIPLLGKLLLGNPIEYRMLWKYTREFENALRVKQLFDNVGLETKFQSYFFDCATGFYGQKVSG